MPIQGVLKGVIEKRVPIKLWSSILSTESAALDQLKNVASLPFVVSHVAAMPDVHWGKGTTVGTVFASRGALVPAAVGVDIGCGMMAVETDISVERAVTKSKLLRSSIEAAIPVGFNSNSQITPYVDKWFGWGSMGSTSLAKDHLLVGKALSQMGTLGGGNHFIELCSDSEGKTWLMLHSGSRNVGKTLAEKHINEAKGIMKRYMIHLPDPDLAYVVEDTPEFKAYMIDLMWCQAYALANREEMMRRLRLIMFSVFGAFTVGAQVNCHHNYAEKEHHFGQNVWVTRKGAVRARVGDLGIIPGSMGTRSYIVRGLGNPDSFNSCAHGAGRRMSRGEAKRTFTVADLAAQTTGVECRKDEGVLDEIPGAYKNIDEVMANQTDLVEVVATLKQFLCVKG